MSEPDNTPWQECIFCKRRDAESRMWLTFNGAWICGDCAAEAEDKESDWEDHFS